MDGKVFGPSSPRRQQSNFTRSALLVILVDVFRLELHFHRPESISERESMQMLMPQGCGKAFVRPEDVDTIWVVCSILEADFQLQWLSTETLEHDRSLLQDQHELSKSQSEAR